MNNLKEIAGSCYDSMPFAAFFGLNEVNNL